MGDYCYMEAFCHRKTADRFEKLGFQEDDWPKLPEGVVYMVDDEANYGHADRLPTDVAWFGRHGAGGDYPAMLIACNSRKLVEVDSTHDGKPCVSIDHLGIVDPEELADAREYLRVKRAAMLALGFSDDHEMMPHPRSAEEALRQEAAMESAALAALRAAVGRMEAVADGILIEKRQPGVSPETHVRHMAGHLAQHAKVARAAAWPKGGSDSDSEPADPEA